jgi:hypothetical protein
MHSIYFRGQYLCFEPEAVRLGPGAFTIRKTHIKPVAIGNASRHSNCGSAIWQKTTRHTYLCAVQMQVLVALHADVEPAFERSCRHACCHCVACSSMTTVSYCCNVTYLPPRGSPCHQDDTRPLHHSNGAVLMYAGSCHDGCSISLSLTDQDI